MDYSVSNRQTHEAVVLNPLLPGCWKSVTILQDLALRFSEPGWKDLFIQSWKQQSDNLVELEEKIWEYGGETHPELYEKDGQWADLENEPPDPMSLNRILLLRSINQLTHLNHLYREVRKTSLPFDLRMILQRQQLWNRETLEHLSSIYVTHPEPAQAPPVLQFSF